MKLKVLILIICTPILMIFQNCGNPFQAGEISNSYSSIGNQAISGKFDLNCLNGSINTACIFFKNPVVNVSEFNLQINSAELFLPINLQASQTYAVNFDQLISGDLLENSNFKVVYPNGLPATANPNTRWMASISADEPLVGAENSFFYAELLNSFFKRNGGNYLSGKQIRIVPDSSATGWSSLQNTVYLEQNSKARYSLDGGIVTHLLNEAAISFATNRQIYNLGTDSKHVDCGPAEGPVYENDCCADVNGCSKAITAGLSDYIVSVIFPKFPAIGEILTQSTSGVLTCSIERNVSLSTGGPASLYFNACGDSTRAGQIFYMGELYGSIWYSVRERITIDQPMLLTGLDQLYVKFLPLLTGNDDFISALNKIKFIDQTQFQSKYSNYFDQVYTQRGMARSN